MGEAAAKEPTMEDILSSIRKIIAEEGEPEAGMADVEPALDSPVELSQEENKPNLQQIAERVSASPAPEAPKAAEPEMALAQNAEPSPQPAAPSPQPTAPPQKASSLADIAASVKAQDMSASSQPAETPVPSPQPPAAPAVPAAAEAENKAPEPAKAETKIEMAEAKPAPAPAPEPVKQQVPEPKAEKPPAAVAENAEGEMEESAFKGALMSPSSNTLVSDSFERLKRSVMDDLDAKTEAILRPMLREWLDENLPTMVERMVREEIERVARG